MPRHLNQLAHLCEELRVRLGADDAMYLEIKSEMAHEAQKQGLTGGLTATNAGPSSPARYPAYLQTLVAAQVPEVHH